LWVDITSDATWKDPVDFDKESLPVCVSTGYLWSKNSNFVKLFADYSLKQNGEIDDLGSTTIIPTSVILKIIGLIIENPLEANSKVFSKTYSIIPNSNLIEYTSEQFIENVKIILKKIGYYQLIKPPTDKILEF
jgi:hypothetical protein